MYTPSDEMFLASPLTDPFSVITLTGHRTSVRGDFRFSTKLLNALYLTGLFGSWYPIIIKQSSYPDVVHFYGMKFLADFLP